MGAEGKDEAAVIAAQHADAVAFADAGAEQGAGEAIGLFVEFLIGHGPGVVDNGGVERVAASANGEQAGGEEAPLIHPLQSLARSGRGHAA